VVVKTENSGSGQFRFQVDLTCSEQSIPIPKILSY